MGGLATGHSWKFKSFWMCTRSEGGLVREAAATAAARGRGGTPRVVGRHSAAATAVPAATAAAEVTTAAATAADLVDLGRGVAQRGADFVDLELDDGALLAFLRLERPLLQAALHDDAGAAGQGLGDVLRRLPPDVAAQEQRLAVLPLARLLVERAGRGRDGEVRDRRTGRGEAQFRVGRQVADHRDDGVSSHRESPSAQALAAAGLAAARLASRRMTLVRSTVSCRDSWRSSSFTASEDEFRSSRA